MSDFEKQMMALEESVRMQYLRDAAFHAKVRMGAQILESTMPVQGEAERRDALRAALLILAVGQQKVPGQCLAVSSRGYECHLPAGHADWLHWHREHLTWGPDGS
jgi:hypothetical protein